MVNMIKDVVNKLDGFSSDNQGFAVTAFTVAENGFTLNVKPYLRKEEEEGMESWKQLPEMCDRLYACYSAEGGHYEVVEAVNKGSYWVLTIKAIEVKSDEV